MKLGEYIMEYRASHDMSQRAFAAKCGLSNGYVSMLEKGVNPTTNEPIKVTLVKFKQIASGMGISVMELMSSVDDIGIDVNGLSKPQPKSSLSEWEQLLVDLFRQIPEDQQGFVLEMIRTAIRMRSGSQGQ